MGFYTRVKSSGENICYTLSLYQCDTRGIGLKLSTSGSFRNFCLFLTFIGSSFSSETTRSLPPSRTMVDQLGALCVELIVPLAMVAKETCCSLLFNFPGSSLDSCLDFTVNDPAKLPSCPSVLICCWIPSC